jgi:uncharacterized membrane protein
VIAVILSSRPVRVCLGLMVFAFLYGLAVLGRIEATVPQLPVAVAIASCLASIIAFLHLIDHVARMLRPVSILSWMGADGASVIESIYPRLLLESPGVGPGRARMGDAPPPLVVRSRAGGVVLAFYVPGLVALAGRRTA